MRKEMQGREMKNQSCVKIWQSQIGVIVHPLLVETFNWNVLSPLGMSIGRCAWNRQWPMCSWVTSSPILSTRSRSRPPFTTSPATPSLRGRSPVRRRQFFFPYCCEYDTLLRLLLPPARANDNFDNLCVSCRVITYGNLIWELRLFLDLWQHLKLIVRFTFIFPYFEMYLTVNGVLQLRLVRCQSGNRTWNNGASYNPYCYRSMKYCIWHWWEGNVGWV